MATVYLTRKEHFSAAHRLHSDHLSDSENRKLFGKCNSKNGHGHNYSIEVTVGCKVDKHGLTMNLSKLKKIIRKTIIDRFDHRHLNLDTKEFKALNPTAENIAIVSWNLLKKQLPLFEVRIHETEKNIATYRGE